MDTRQTSLQRIPNLYDFSRRMSSAAGTEVVLEALADHLAHSVSSPVAVLIVESGDAPTIRSQAGQAIQLQQEEIEAAWAQIGAEPIRGENWLFLQLATNQEPMGMVAIQRQVDSEQIDLARSLCDQAAIALDRTKLVADLEQASLVSETEQLRSALLSSVSHDLRTPLASIIGSTTSLLEYGESFSVENRKELLATVVEEAQRLDRHIQNLLDMTRLGQGTLTLKRDWVDLHDVVFSAVSRLRDAIKELPISVDIASDVPLLWVHGILIEQALVNLLDNAICFSPADGHITLRARMQNGQVMINLCDCGPGIPEDEREKIFDMFYTMRKGDRRNLQGTGLGLAICRGMVAAHGGSVTAHDGLDGRGTCMRIELPLVQPDGAVQT
jgi:two-component system, OmpR family, sensor histidine kinase KdpD